jgi:hypothetical protein
MLNSIPTDNFYKFQFIAGLLIVLFLIVYFNERVENDALKIIAIEGETAELQLQNSFWEFEINRLDSLLNELSLKLEIEETEFQSLKSKADSLYNAYKNIHSEMISLGVKNDLVSESINRTSRYYYLSLVLFILGIYWIFAGYIGWFFKHQKYQDIIVRAEAKIKENELEKIQDSNNETT